MTVDNCGSLSKSLSPQERLQEVRLWLNLLCFHPSIVLYKQWVLNNEMTHKYLVGEQKSLRTTTKIQEAWISSHLNKRFYIHFGLIPEITFYVFLMILIALSYFCSIEMELGREICTISSRWVSVSGSRYYITQLSIIFLWPHTKSKLPLSVTVFENTIFEAV